MGNWQLEVFRMSLYIAFPVVMFHWFNQPENFEEWVTKIKRDLYPPDTNREMFENFIRDYNKKKDEAELRAMEEAHRKNETKDATNKYL